MKNNKNKESKTRSRHKKIKHKEDLLDIVGYERSDPGSFARNEYMGGANIKPLDPQEYNPFHEQNWKYKVVQQDNSKMQALNVLPWNEEIKPLKLRKPLILKPNEEAKDVLPKLQKYLEEQEAINLWMRKREEVLILQSKIEEKMARREQKDQSTADASKRDNAGGGGNFSAPAARQSNENASSDSESELGDPKLKTLENGALIPVDPELRKRKLEGEQLEELQSKKKFVQYPIAGRKRMEEEDRMTVTAKNAWLGKGLDLEKYRQ